MSRSLLSTSNRQLWLRELIALVALSWPIALTNLAQIAMGRLHNDDGWLALRPGVGPSGRLDGLRIGGCLHGGDVLTMVMAPRF